MSDRRKDPSDLRTDPRHPTLTASHDTDTSVQPDKDAEGDSCTTAHLREGLPARMILQGHLPIAATETIKPTEPEVLTGPEMLRRIQAKQTRALGGEARLLPESMEETLGLFLTSQGMNLQATKTPLPYNYQKLPHAGRSLLVTFAKVPEAQVMASKIGGLEEDLDTAARAEALLAVLTPLTEVVAANRAQALDRAAKKIEAGLSRVESLMDNAQLAVGMRPAFDLRAKPAKDAQQTRARNERLIAETEAQHQAHPASGATPPAGSLPGAAGAAGAADATTTVTTKVAPPPLTAAAAPPAAAPSRAGTRRKPTSK